MPQGFQGQQYNLLSELLRGGPRVDQFFGGGGGLGSPATALQRQSLGGISQYLNQPAPEQRALDISMPALQGILNGKPGQGVIDALQPTFERNLAGANQQGGRFGSGNAILRSRALEDFNLLGAQAAQQGQQTQLQASQMLALLSGQAGQNPFNRLQGAYGIGQQEAGQQDLETQRRIQLMAYLFGAGQNAATNLPWAQTKAASGGLGGFLGSLLGLGLGAATVEVGGAFGDRLGGKIFGQGGK